MATGRIGVTPTLRTRWSKQPTTGTTSLSGLDDNSVALVYDVGYEAVYRNGTLLSRGNDYTATNGTTVTLIDATLAGDIIEILANQLVPLSDAISKGQYTAKGALLSATAASTPGVLAVGANDTVLTADSTTATGLKWAAAAAGGANYTLLNSGGTTLSGDTTVSGISGKSDLLIYVDAATNLTQTIASLRLNADTTAKYIYAGSQINGLASYSANYFENENSTISGATSIPLGRYNDVTTNALSAAIKIDGCSTSGFKTFNLNGSGSGTPNQRNYNLTGIYLGTAAITSITIRAAAGAFTGGKVYVYGA